MGHRGGVSIDFGFFQSSQEAEHNAQRLERTTRVEGEIYVFVKESPIPYQEPVRKAAARCVTNGMTSCETLEENSPAYESNSSGAPRHRFTKGRCGCTPFHQLR